MPFALGPRATQAAYRLAVHETIDSTSAEAVRCFRNGDPGRLWVVAGTQTAGHGRRGSKWESPQGNLAASLLLPLTGSQTHAATLGFAAGLALESAVRNCAPEIAVSVGLDAADTEEERLRLKWPNDLLVGSAKLAGILLEMATRPDGSRAVVIGFGVNIARAPAGLPYPATSLAACGSDVTAEMLFASLTESWMDQETVWDEGRGFPAVRRRWLDRAAGLGAPVAVKLGDTVLRGIFETIDGDGMLVVRESGGTARRIAAGDVHFGAAATVRQVKNAG